MCHRDLLCRRHHGSCGLRSADTAAKGTYWRDILAMSTEGHLTVLACIRNNVIGTTIYITAAGASPVAPCVVVLRILVTSSIACGRLLRSCQIPVGCPEADCNEVRFPRSGPSTAISCDGMNFWLLGLFYPQPRVCTIWCLLSWRRDSWASGRSPSCTACEILSAGGPHTPPNGPHDCCIRVPPVYRSLGVQV